MSKIVKNTTGSSISVTDVGVTIGASPAQYVIPEQDYLLWAASSDIVTHVGSGDLVINDGSYDLNISDGIDLIKGLFPRKLGVLAGDDLTEIGHVADKLKVIDEDAIDVLNNISIAIGAGSTLSVLRQNEVNVTSRNKFDLANTEYTVPAGKTFVLTSFAGSYDAQAALYVRIEKQTGGTGPWVTQFRLTMMSGGQGDSTISMNFGNGITLGTVGDKFKLTIEASVAKGTVWAEFSGSEI